MSSPASALALPQPRFGAAWLTPLELVLLGAIWGASFLFMRVAVPYFGPFALVELRLAAGAMVLLPFLWLARAQFPLRLWPLLMLIAAINTAVPFALFAWAAERAPAGIGGITNAMTVPFTALVGFLFFSEKIGSRRAMALIAGFAGVVVLASGRSAGASVGWAAAAGCLAAFLYAIGIHLVRRHLSGLPSAAVAGANLLCSSLLALPFALVFWPGTNPPMHAWGAALGLGVLCTGIAMVMYYRLIAQVGPGRTSTVTYLVPVFAVGWAWWLLDEPVTVPMLLAGALILGSVAVSQRAAR